MRGHEGRDVSSPRAELYALYAEVDAVLAGYQCECAALREAPDAKCCDFAATGREPLPTPVELAEVFHAVRALGMRGAAQPKASKRRGARSLPVVGSAGACPLLSNQGRCRIYAARPFGCRTFFCKGREPTRPDRARVRAISRRLADLSARAFPRDPHPRRFLRALAETALFSWS